MSSKYQIMKILEFFFKKYQLPFLDQPNSSSDPSQILILQFSISRASLSPSPSLSNFSLAKWNPFQHNLHHVLHRFLYFVLSHWSRSHYKYWIYQTICKARLIKVIVKLYTDQNTLWAKYTTHQKAECSKLDNMVNSNSTFNTKHAEFSTKL